MSAILCGKRSFFEDLPASPQSASPPVSKRLRNSSSTSPVRFSPFSPFDQLKALFPDMDNQLLERALDDCGNDINAAIKRLHELSLGHGAENSDLAEESNENLEKDAKFAGTAATNRDAAPSAYPASQNNHQMNGAEWVELFVREMMSATSIDDARSRATRVLESLEQSISVQAGAEAAQNYHKENVMLKEQIEVLLRENIILKRAVSIQHERQKEYDERNQEVQHLKQLVSQYQEKLRGLEVTNYALTMHLQQAQQSNSIPGRFNPDVF